MPTSEMHRKSSACVGCPMPSEYVPVSQEEFFRVLGPRNVHPSLTKAGSDWRLPDFSILGRTVRDEITHEITEFQLRSDLVRKAVSNA